MDPAPQAVSDPDGGLCEGLWAARDRDRAGVRAAAQELPAGPEREVLLAYLSWRAGDLAGAVEGAETLHAALPAGRWRVRALNILGNVRAELGHLEAAQELLHEQYGVAQGCGDVWGALMARHDLGVLHLGRDPGRSRAYLEEALSGAREHGDQTLELMALFNLAVLALGAGDQPGFDRWLAQARALPEGLSPDLSRLVLVLTGEQALQRGDDAALRAALAELRARPPSDDPVVQYEVTLLESGVALHAGDPAACVRQLQELLSRTPDEQRGLVQDALSQAHEAAGELPQALACAREVTAWWREYLGGQRERQVRALEVWHRTEHAQRQAEFERQRAEELAAALSELRAAHSRIQELSVRDMLTGLHNRLHLMDVGPALLDPGLLSPAQPGSAPAQVALIDVDSFKAINDRYGHAAGDEVLRGLADTLRRHLRPADLAVRYGGEEFVVLRPGEPGAPPLADDLNAFAAALAARRWSLCPRPVTVSVGVVEALGDDLDGALARADLHMYAAKHAGGNRVQTPAPPAPPPSP